MLSSPNARSSFGTNAAGDCELTAVTDGVKLIALSFWRTRSGYLRHAFATNTALMSVGFVLTGYQVAGYYLAS